MDVGQVWNRERSWGGRARQFRFGGNGNQTGGMVERGTDPVVSSEIGGGHGLGRETKELTLHRMFLGPDICLGF